MLTKIISGGQTGADRGALEAALENSFPYGGHVPLGRKAEDGQVPAKFNQMIESTSPKYPPRTAANVSNSDGTIIIFTGQMSPGVKLTKRLCQQKKKPFLMVVYPNENFEPCWEWVVKHNISVLNVAGTRESKCPGICDFTFDLVDTLLEKNRQ